MPRKSNFTGQVANRAEMAGILGVSPTTLDRYVAAGCPVAARGTLRREYQFNSAQVIAWRDRREAEARAQSADATEDDAKRRHQLAAAELKELELAEKRGQMIRVDDVRPILEEELGAVRSRL